MKFILPMLVLTVALPVMADYDPEKQYKWTCPDGTHVYHDKPSKKGRVKVKSDKPDLVKEEVGFGDIPNWPGMGSLGSLVNVIESNCSAKNLPDGWDDVCRDMDYSNPVKFIENNFTPYQLYANRIDKKNPKGVMDDDGLITGYYVPELAVSLKRTEEYHIPIYRYDDSHERMSRDEVDSGSVNEEFIVAYTNDYYDLFNMQIQGSGEGVYPNGERVGIRYNGKSKGYPYISIGRVLSKCGVMENITSPKIARWIDKASHEETMNLLRNNQTYVYHVLTEAGSGTITGSQNVPLTPYRSLAIDRSILPLGTMLYLDTTLPSGHPLQLITIGQDTGGAIKKSLRADVYMGVGQEALDVAGEMKQSGKFWLLEPNK